LGPAHKRAPELPDADTTPNGRVIEFTMSSADSKYYPGIARDPDTFGTPDPTNPAKLDVTTSHPAPYTRKVAVYIPSSYKRGDAAPFIVGADGPDHLLFAALDTLIAALSSASPSATAAAMHRAASAASNTTPCPAATLSSSNTKCCRASRARRT
jgi:hypothetical protein